MPLAMTKAETAASTNPPEETEQPTVEPELTATSDSTSSEQPNGSDLPRQRRMPLLMRAKRWRESRLNREPIGWFQEGRPFRKRSHRVLHSGE